MKNRYLVFSGEHYYPSGGANDFQLAFDNLSDAKAFCRGIELDDNRWANILDTQELNKVDHNEN